jgi:hypothetical protein
MELYSAIDLHSNNSHVANRAWVTRPSRLQMAVKLTFLREWEEVTLGELQQGSGTSVLLVLKVRPEAFPNGSPMPVW